MLRGTVYLVVEPNAEWPKIDRHVLELDVEGAREFQERATAALWSLMPEGSHLEFGPIGFSWGK